MVPLRPLGGLSSRPRVSFVVAYGATIPMLRRGRADGLLGISCATYLSPFIVVCLFVCLFVACGAWPRRAAAVLALCALAFRAGAFVILGREAFGSSAESKGVGGAFAVFQHLHISFTCGQCRWAVTASALCGDPVRPMASPEDLHI